MTSGPDIISSSDMQITFRQLCATDRYSKLVGNKFLFFHKNLFSKKIETEICEILKIV